MKKNNLNIETFDSWAKKGKDESMQLGHTPSVDRMIEILSNQSSSVNGKFTFLDIGCGNGWVVRKFADNQKCIRAAGVDGSKTMIEKAKKNCSKGDYICADIETWVDVSKFDVVFSMETFYYFSQPDLIVKNLYNNLLNDHGCFIMGIDHYRENKSSLSWEKDFNIKTTTLDIAQWKKIFINAGFTNIYMEQFNSAEDWSGTLILMGSKIYDF